MLKYIITLLLTAGIGLPARVSSQSAFSLPGIALPGIALDNSAVTLPGISIETLLADAPPCSSNGCTILPVTLLKFEAYRQNNSQVLLNWETTNEYNLAGFGVERSLGTTSSFTNRTFVASQSGYNLKKKYDLTDPNAYAGTSYYRLRQTDVDGKFVYSNIVAVKGYGSAETMSLYPNPVKTDVQLGLYVGKTGNATVSILNEAGKTVYQQNIRLYTGSNTSTLLLSFLPQGMYLVKTVTPAGTVLFDKFIKN